VQEGSKLYPPTALTANFANNLFVPCYKTLFSGTGIFNQNEEHTINFHDYPNGYTLNAFIFSPTSTLDDTTWDVVKDSLLILKLVLLNV